MKRLFTIAVLLFLPTLCLAEQTTTWNFQTGQVPGGISHTSSLNLQQTAEGLDIAATAAGSIKGTIDPDFRFDVVEITYMAERELNPAIIWNDPGSESDEFLLAPIILPASGEPASFRFDLNRYNEWMRRTDRIGIAFTEGDAITVQSMQFVGYNLFDNAREAWLTFWTLDRIRPSAVNFLVGPQLTFTPVAREQLHHHSPPFSESANWAIYAVLGIVVMVAAFISVRKQVAGSWERGAARFPMLLLFFTISALWLLYDLRMGSEFFGYVARDYRTYWSQPIGSRTLRERKFFYDFAEIVRQFLAGEPRYVFISDHDWPYIGILKYATFPSVPMKPEVADASVRIWAVYDKPDIALNERGQLVDSGNVLSPPGKILHEFADGIFLFTTDT